MSIFVSSIAITRNIAPLTAIRKDPRSEKYVSDFFLFVSYGFNDFAS